MDEDFISTKISKKRLILLPHPYRRHNFNEQRDFYLGSHVNMEEAYCIGVNSAAIIITVYKFDWYAVLYFFRI